MGRRKKKTIPALLLRWIIVLSAILLGMTVLAVTLKYQHASKPHPTLDLPTGLKPNPFHPSDFSYDENGYVTCLTAESIPGIDVSSHQGQIDWQAVKESGIQFAIIRLGYRGYHSGTIHADETAQKNLAGARAAGLKIGAYFFSQATNIQEAKEEARFALQMLDGLALDLPLVYDWEYVSESARTGETDAQTLMDCIHAFCGEVEKADYQSMVYFNQDLANTLLDLEQVDQYPFWLAMYADRLTYPYQVCFWQYSDEGSVPGIEGNVDLDLYFP